MPCYSDYMEPTVREQYNQQTANLLVYLLESLNCSIPLDVRKEAENIYATVDYTSTLCGHLKSLTPNLLDEIVYNGRNKNARQLADWWEKHLETDRKHELQEQEERKQKELRKSALKKLTKEERVALGL